MNPALVSGVLGMGRDLIARIFPDPEKRAEAERALAQLEQNGDMKRLALQLNAIFVEGASEDPWTSRARPSFLYVMYLMILTSIPMGVVYAIWPGVAANITAGMEAWLAAIPTEMWALFGTGYLGYTVNRSWQKNVQAKALARQN